MRRWNDAIPMEADGAGGGGAADGGAGVADGAGADGAAAGGVAGGAAGGGTAATGGGKAATDFFSGLDEKVRSDPGLAKFAGKSVNDLAVAYLNAQKLIGKDTSGLIDPAAFKDNVQGLMQALGAPDNPDKYDFKDLDIPPESPLAGDEAQQFFKASAREAGLLPAQARALFTAYAKQFAAQEKAAAEAAEKNIMSLKLDWGQDYEEQAKFAKSAASALGIRDVLNNAGLGSDPAVVKALAKIGRMLGEPGAPGTGLGNMSPESAQAKADDMTRQSIALRFTNPTESRRLAAEAMKLRERAGPIG